jgi:hypothetical protein
MKKDKVVDALKIVGRDGMVPIRMEKAMTPLCGEKYVRVAQKDRNEGRENDRL